MKWKHNNLEVIEVSSNALMLGQDGNGLIFLGLYKYLGGGTLDCISDVGRQSNCGQQYSVARDKHYISGKRTLTLGYIMVPCFLIVDLR